MCSDVLRIRKKSFSYFFSLWDLVVRGVLNNEILQFFV